MGCPVWSWNVLFGRRKSRSREEEEEVSRGEGMAGEGGKDWMAGGAGWLAGLGEKEGEGGEEAFGRSWP